MEDMKRKKEYIASHPLQKGKFRDTVKTIEQLEKEEMEVNALYKDEYAIYENCRAGEESKNHMLIQNLKLLSEKLSEIEKEMENVELQKKQILAMQKPIFVDWEHKIEHLTNHRIRVLAEGKLNNIILISY